MSKPGNPNSKVRACDMHVHTSFSDDSRQSMEGQCARALELGLDALCFTEHLDFDALSLDYYDPDAYFAELRRLREVYEGRLELLAGLELSEPHRHPKELEEARRRPYDFILGSVHYWLGGLFPSQMRDSKMDVRLCCEAYWAEMLRMARYGGFDCVAHLDFPKRFFMRMEYDPAMLDEIFGAMGQNGLILEINTSSLRRGCGETMPGEALLRQYIAHGGRYVTLGSDAHVAEDLYAGVPGARDLAEGLGLTPAVFRGRKLSVLT